MLCRLPEHDRCGYTLCIIHPVRRPQTEPPPESLRALDRHEHNVGQVAFVGDVDDVLKQLFGDSATPASARNGHVMDEKAGWMFRQGQ